MILIKFYLKTQTIYTYISEKKIYIYFKKFCDFFNFSLIQYSTIDDKH